MCYSGRCEYEITSGDFVGDCSLPRGAVFPDDAHCVIVDKAQELDAAGLLDDIDIDDTDAITAAYEDLVERRQEFEAQEEALSELESLDPCEGCDNQGSSALFGNNPTSGNDLCGACRGYETAERN